VYFRKLAKQSGKIYMHQILDDTYLNIVNFISIVGVAVRIASSFIKQIGELYQLEAQVRPNVEGEEQGGCFYY